MREGTLLLTSPLPLPGLPGLAPNIARYAPGVTTAVTVTYQPDRTVVTVEDHVRAPQATILAGAGGGHGLTAMRERAARAGPTADGWRVELEVPP